MFTFGRDQSARYVGVSPGETQDARKVGVSPGRDDKCTEDGYSPDEMNYYYYIVG